MPVVEVKVVGKLSKQQKAEIVKQFTKTLEEVAGKPPKYTYIHIQEIDGGDFAMEGKLFS